MKISKIYFKNIFGITEKSLLPRDVTIFEGPNECGKTSFLDALKVAFTNNNIRSRVVHKDANEAEMLVELDDGTVIDRRKRTEKSDYIKIKNGTETIQRPEGYLETLFSKEQFNPIRDFIELRPAQQKKVLLSLCEIDFKEEDYINNFGELPQDYDYTNHVLENLERIQSKNGQYYLKREDLNRDRRAKENVKDEVLKALPEGYNPIEWATVNLSDIYTEINKGLQHNNDIEKTEVFLENVNDKTAVLANSYNERIQKVKEGYKAKEEDIKKEITRLENQILLLKERLNSIAGIVEKEVETIEEQKQEAIKEMQERTQKALEYIADNKKVDVTELEEKAKHIEKMKSYLRDAEKVQAINSEILELKNKADEFTRKIEIARKLPGELLQKAKMPVDGITLQDGELLIDGLPLDNLSEGRQMEIALEVAKAKAGELKVVLVDGFEKLCKDRQEKFIEKAKQTGLQFFLTRVSDGEGLNIIEL